MSDAGRKSFTDKASESIKPDSSKSQTEKTKEGLTDMGDKATRSLGTDDTKSNTQSVANKAGHSKDEHTKEGGSGGSIVDSAKHAIGMDK